MHIQHLRSCLAARYGIEKTAGVLDGAIYGAVAPDGSGAGMGALRGLGSGLGGLLGSLGGGITAEALGASNHAAANLAAMIGSGLGTVGGYYGTRALAGKTKKEKAYEKIRMGALKQEAEKAGLDASEEDLRDLMSGEDRDDMLKGVGKTLGGGAIGGLGGWLTGGLLTGTDDGAIPGAAIGGGLGLLAGWIKHLVDQRDKFKERTGMSAGEFARKIDALSSAADGLSPAMQKLKKKQSPEA